MTESNHPAYDGAIRSGSHYLDGLVPYVFWTPQRGTATLDGYFTADDLEQIAAHMRRHKDG